MQFTAFGRDKFRDLSSKMLRSMKVSALLLLLALQVAARPEASAQVTLKEKGTPLEKVLKAIKKQSQYDLFFDENLVKAKGRPVVVDVSNVPVEQALVAVFKYQDQLSYSLNGKIISVKAKEEKKVPKESNNGTNIEAVGVTPADITVKGRIVNENGEPVAGASIQIKGTKRGTSADGNGTFTLTNVDENATLVVSGTNIETVEMRVQGRTELSITAKVKVNELEEVIVGKGYYEEKQKYTVGNSVRITAKEIERQPVSNPLFALQGRVTGLRISQNTGLANGGFNLSIQGISNINTLTSNAPLIVVDGVPLPFGLPASASRLTGVLDPNLVGTSGGETIGNNPIGFINPGDIESIDILKDADATAIYGSRAAYGAIIITTKRGQSGKGKVSVGIQQGFGRVAKKLDLLTTRQYLDMRYEAIRNDGIGIGTTAAFNDLRIWDTTRYTNWQKELIGDLASYTNINASVAGGTEAAQYLIGGNFYRTTNVFPGNFSNSRGSVHFNINTISANKKLKISLSGSYSISNNGVPGKDLTEFALQLAPNAPALYNGDGSVNWEPNPSGASTFENPIAYAVTQRYEHRATLLNSSAQVNYLLKPGLSISTRLGYSNTNVNSFTGFPFVGIKPEERIFFQRSSSFNNSSASTWIIEPQLNYKRDVASGVLDILVGATVQNNFGNNLFVRASGFPSDLLLRNLSSATSQSSDYTYSEYRYNAVFGKFNYILNKTYIVNITGRRDGSSRFGKNNRFGNFWSAGGAWIFSETFKGGMPRFLNFGKLKLSYGITGSDGISDYLYLNTYGNIPIQIPYQGITSLQSNGINNPYIQWQENKKLLLGIDVNLFKDKLKLSATYNRNRCSNQLIDYALPAITGVSSVKQNFQATVQNTSWEFVLSGLLINTKSFSWRSDLNLTVPQNKVISFPDIENTAYSYNSPFSNIGIMVGAPLNSRYLYRYLAVDPATGNYLFENIDGSPSPTPTANDFRGKKLVSMQTRYYGGWVNSFSYKRITLDFNFEFVREPGLFFDANFASYSPGQFISSTGFANQLSSVLNSRWEQPGEGSEFAKFSSNTLTTSRIRQSDGAYTFAPSFIRLKNLSISWQLPPNLLRKIQVHAGTLFFRGQNVLTITTYRGLDPESKGMSLPPLQVMTIGFNLTF